jgi:hypothetical protein
MIFAITSASNQKLSDFGHSMANTALTWNWIKGGTKRRHTKEGGYSYMNHTALVPDFHARLRGHPYMTPTIGCDLAD